jgi:hypothetical protein
MCRRGDVIDTSHLLDGILNRQLLKTPRDCRCPVRLTDGLNSLWISCFFKNDLPLFHYLFPASRMFYPLSSA